MTTLHLGSKTWILLNSKCNASEIIAIPHEWFEAQYLFPVGLRAGMDDPCRFLLRNGPKSDR